MNAPEVVVLDTREAVDKAAFLAACARDLDFPDYFGHNWDALADCLSDFVARHTPVLVVWTGASVLSPADRRTAMQIMTERFTEGADVLVVDAPEGPAGPDFAADHVHLPIPPGAVGTAVRFWSDVVGLHPIPGSCDPDDVCLAGDAVVVHLSEHCTSTTPAIAARDIDALVGRLAGAGAPVELRQDPGMPLRVRTTDPFDTPLEFIEFPPPEEQ